LIRSNTLSSLIFVAKRFSLNVKEKSFKAFTPGDNVIKLFTSVI